MRKHPPYKREWIEQHQKANIEQLMKDGAVCCGDAYARIETVRKFIERALDEQDDAIKKEMEVSP